MLIYDGFIDKNTHRKVVVPIQNIEKLLELRTYQKLKMFSKSVAIQSLSPSPYNRPDHNKARRVYEF